MANQIPGSLQPWHNDLVLEFLENYKKEPVIWDPSHRHHRNKVELNAAWCRVQEAMAESGIEVSVMDLKRKKESLMTAWRSQFKRKICDPDYQSNWFAFSTMYSFLGEVYEAEWVQKNGSKPAKSEPRRNSASSDPEYTQVVAEKCHTKRPRPSQQVVQKSHPFYSPNHLEKRINVPKTENKREMDECELYCTLLVKKLRRLDEHQRDIAMHEIDNIVFRAKMNSTPRQKLKSPLFIVAQHSSESYDEDNVKYQEDEDPMHEEYLDT